MCYFPPQATTFRVPEARLGTKKHCNGRGPSKPAAAAVRNSISCALNRRTLIGSDPFVTDLHVI
jgi:hypothetical protein